MKNSDLDIKLGVSLCLIYPYMYCIYFSLTGGVIKVTYLYILSILVLTLSLFVRNSASRFILKGSVPTFFIIILILSVMVIKGSQTQAIFLEYTAMLFCCFTLSLSTGWLKYIAKIALGAGVFYAITVIFQAINPDGFEQLVKPLFIDTYQSKFISLKIMGYNSGLTTQVAIVCGYIIVGVGVVFGKIYAAIRNGKRVKTIYKILLLILLLAVLLSGKRATLIFGILAVITVCFFNAENISKKFKIIFGLILVAVIIYIFVVPIIEMSNFGAFSTLQRIFNMLDSGDLGNGRGYYWNLGFNIIKEHPISGIGWENYTKFAGTNFNCHNIYIQLLAELGIPLAMLLFTLMFYTWNKTRKLMMNIYLLKSDNYAAIIVSFFLQTYFLAYGFAGNPMYDSEYIAMYGISIAVYLSCLRYHYCMFER